MGGLRSNGRKRAVVSAKEGVSRLSQGLAIVGGWWASLLVKYSRIKELQKMSGAFEKRQKGFESKWAHDEELRFKVFARRNKLLGVWAAGELGLKADAADAYAKEVVAADFQKAGDEDVFEKVRDDFKAKGVAISDHMLRVKMEELIQTAKSQIEQEVAKK
jgi:hypothetical protein